MHVNDNDNHHSFSEPTAHQALTCAKDHCDGVAAPGWRRKFAQCTNNLSKHSAQISRRLKYSGLACAGKEMCYTQYECVVRNPGCFCFGRVCLVWLLWCCGGSTVDKLREDESRIVVLLPRKQSHREIDRNVFPSPCIFDLGAQSLLTPLSLLVTSFRASPPLFFWFSLLLPHSLILSTVFSFPFVSAFSFSLHLKTSPSHCPKPRT